MRIICIPSTKVAIIAYVEELQAQSYQDIYYLSLVDDTLQSNPTLIGYTKPLAFLMDLITR